MDLYKVPPSAERLCSTARKAVAADDGRVMLLDYSWRWIAFLALVAYVVAALVLGIYSYVVNPPSRADLIAAGFPQPPEPEAPVRKLRAPVPGKGRKKKGRRDA